METSYLKETRRRVIVKVLFRFESDDDEATQLND